MMHWRLAFIWVAALGMMGDSELPGQMTRVQNGFNSLSNDYFSRIGVNFGFSIPGSPNPNRGVVGLNPDGTFTSDGSIRFTQGSASVVPGFGGFDPNSGANFGFGARSGGGGFNLGISAAQGSSTSSSTTAGSVVVSNGVPGQFFSGQIRPFVTSVVPVVGGYSSASAPWYSPGPAIHPLQQKLAQLEEEGGLERLSTAPPSTPSRAPQANRGSQHSSATRGDLSVAEIRRQKHTTTDAGPQMDRIKELVRRAEISKAKGNRSSARVYYKQAMDLATGDLKSALRARYQALDSR